MFLMHIDIYKYSNYLIKAIVIKNVLALLLILFSIYLNTLDFNKIKNTLIFWYS